MDKLNVIIGAIQFVLTIVLAALTYKLGWELATNRIKTKFHIEPGRIIVSLPPSGLSDKELANLTEEIKTIRENYKREHNEDIRR
jgi:hypothetical protein